MSNKPFDLVGYLAQDLEARRAGGGDCPVCRKGRIQRSGQNWTVECPDCNGTGKSPAITQAEAALAAARGLVEREKELQCWAEAQQYRSDYTYAHIFGAEVFAILNAPPVEEKP